jgi:amino acid adenylation domain-containing protein
VSPHPTLVQDFLRRSATRLPDKVALVCDGRRWTYAELDRATNRLAHGLKARGVGRGDRVVLCLPNSADAVLGIFAVLKAGAVFVMLNPTMKREKLAHVVRDCAAAVLWVDAGAANRGLVPAPSETPSVLFTVACGGGAEQAAPRLQGGLPREALETGSPETPPETPRIDLDLACLIYTSGSTGEPKGVMSDHSNVVFAASSIIAYLGNAEQDVVLDALPLSFDYGLYQLLMTFCFGGTLVLERSFAYPAAVLKRVMEERVTGLPGVPTLFALLLQMDLGAFDLSSLRYVTNTAAAFPVQHILELRRRLPGVAVYSMYGLTETKRTLYLPPEQLDARPGSVGIPIPGTEAWIEDEHGRRLGPGESGELVVRGRHVMRGYWGDAEATRLRFRPGALPGERLCYTGDIFRMDDAGCFFFLGRRGDFIKSRGEKISPKEIENVLYDLPGVVEAAVIGVPDPILGEAIKAFVVFKGPRKTKAEVLAHCKARLEDGCVPRDVEFRDELPKTASGKIHRSGLT